MEDDDDIREEITQFFRLRWTVPVGVIGSFMPPPPSKIVSEQENQELIKPVSKGEVWRALWSLTEDKAPGPDGFPPMFFRHYWSIIQEDMVAIVQDFFTHR